MITTIQNPAEAGRIMRARIRLLIDHPWFGQLALNLKVTETTKCPAMATDGTHLFYNPTWTAAQTDDVLSGTVAHEAMHCGLRHMFRCQGREMKLWNQATDYAINPLLDASKIQLPEGVLRSAAYSGLAAETIYAKLVHEQQEKQRREEQEQQDNAQNDAAQDESDESEDSDEQPEPEDSGDQSDDESDRDQSDEPGEEEGEGPGQGDFDNGDLLPAPKASDVKDGADGETDAPLTDMDWEIIADQATMVATKRGLMPADADRAFRETLEPKVNWREVLRRFVDQTMPSDYNWSRPNRRYVAQGLYLPAVVKENAPRLLIALDTSGSIDQSVLDTFSAELSAIMMEVRPSAIDVVSCDARIQNVETFTADDGEIIPHPKGGGGTAFQPVFDWVEEQDEQPAAIIYLTDLDGDEPREPAMPVLWVTPERVTKEGLFGETIRIPAA